MVVEEDMTDIQFEGHHIVVGIDMDQTVGHIVVVVVGNIVVEIDKDLAEHKHCCC